MAFAFGSRAKGLQTTDSDLDIAVYFYPKADRLEWEEDCEYSEEDTIWSEVEKIAGKSTDLLVLNRAASTVAFAVLEEGIPLCVKDDSLYWAFYLATSSTAEDFRQFAREFWEIKQRSGSMSDIEHDRLLRIIDFLECELCDIAKFKEFKEQRYLTDSSFRRDVERWTENLVNASIDIGKILLASSHKRIPQTYREVLENLGLMEGFSTDTAQLMAKHARLRNILAHEYLNIRYKQIAFFISQAEPLFHELLTFAKTFVQ